MTYQQAEFEPLTDRPDLPGDINQIPSWMAAEMAWLTMEGQALLIIEELSGREDTSA